MKLQGKVAMVTGTSPNIGGGIVEELAREGAAIIAVDATAENAEDCATYINAVGGRAIACTCDVTDAAQVEQTVRSGVQAFGRIDILVNNAAWFNRGGVLDMPVADWIAQTGVILTGGFLCTKLCVGAMVAGGVRGCVINIVSTAGHQGEAGNVAYSTAKGGLLNFTRSAAMELAIHGIRVNSLTPTATDPREATERARRWGRKNPPVRDLSTLGRFVERIPLGRLPKPSDYGKAAVFLASDDAAMITGVDLRVDAGAIAQYWAGTRPAAAGQILRSQVQDKPLGGSQPSGDDQE